MISSFSFNRKSQTKTVLRRFLSDQTAYFSSEEVQNPVSDVVWLRRGFDVIRLDEQLTVVVSLCLVYCVLQPVESKTGMATVVGYQFGPDKPPVYALMVRHANSHTHTRARARTHARTHTHTHIHTHRHTRTHTHTYTHTHIQPQRDGERARERWTNFIFLPKRWIRFFWKKIKNK